MGCARSPSTECGTQACERTRPCSEYRCGHLRRLSVPAVGRSSDSICLSDLEPRFVCKQSGTRHADIRPDFAPARMRTPVKSAWLGTGLDALVGLDASGFITSPPYGRPSPAGLAGCQDLDQKYISRKIGSKSGLQRPTMTFPWFAAIEALERP